MPAHITKLFNKFCHNWLIGCSWSSSKNQILYMSLDDAQKPVDIHPIRIRRCIQPKTWCLESCRASCRAWNGGNAATQNVSADRTQFHRSPRRHDFPNPVSVLGRVGNQSSQAEVFYHQIPDWLNSVCSLILLITVRQWWLLGPDAQSVPSTHSTSPNWRSYSPKRNRWYLVKALSMFHGVPYCSMLYLLFNFHAIPYCSRCSIFVHGAEWYSWWSVLFQVFHGVLWKKTLAAAAWACTIRNSL